MNENAPASVPQALSTLLDELALGSGRGGAWILNPDDPGLLRSLDGLGAEAASAAPANGAAPIAAQVNHVRYGFELLNRWARGENPYADADWSASWNRRSVTEGEWAELRADLRREIEGARQVMQRPLPSTQIELNGLVGIVAHLAYHLGAIRQIDRSLRGPQATD